MPLSEYEFLKVRRFTNDPLALGWQGPITDDTDNWSFWTAPLRGGWGSSMGTAGALRPSASAF